MSLQFGRMLIAIGILLLAAGLLWYKFGDKLHWIGRLPGDIRIERENFRFYFPLTTMLLFSLLANLVFQVVRRFF